ncbi:hypothetical protein KPH14_010917, partial [Odynerus spinipes]
MMEICNEMTEIAISRSEFFYVWRSFPKHKQLNELYTYILKKSCVQLLCEESEKSVRVNISNVCKRINDRWEKSGRKEEDFRRKFEVWLQAEDFIIFN